MSWVIDTSVLSQLRRPRPEAKVFASRILPIGAKILLNWLRLVSASRKIRHTFTPPDLFLAATALHQDLTLVTTDIADFRLAGAKRYNPWTDPPGA